MNERPILFSAPMVRAILEGHKTQTRRVIKQQPERFWGSMDHAFASGVLQCVVTTDGKPRDKYIVCPYGVPGERLWVRETWTGTFHCDHFHVAYAADGSERCLDAPVAYILPKAALKPSNWVTPLFMPRWASRITLEITDVRVQRLQDISEQDSLAEGAALDSDGFPMASAPIDDGYDTAIEWFADLWDSINAKRGFGWDVNPWVWALTFRRIP